MTDRVSLPPDPDGLNEDRAVWAAKSLRVIMETTGTDWCDALQDLLVDLMHLADRDDELDFERDLARARDHCIAETTEGGGGYE